MSYMQKPPVHHPALKRNELGLTHRDYEGSMSTLCAGCGHDSITAAVIEACFDLDVPAHRVAKISGIGCSSKTPTYFLGRSHGFNSVHGRMPSVTTGANLANRDLIYLGVSGDGDTASIGLGQFAHAVRRKLNMIYIVMNNGCYGLTKGQFSATSDKGSPSKKGEANPFDAIDLCQMAIQLGAGFVARSFSGDKSQLIPLIKAAVSYRGFALLDVISPCVTFNNHAASTKSYEYVRAHNMASENKLDYVEPKEEITIDYDEGSSAAIELHDGSRLVLHKLDGSHDPRNANAALSLIRRSAAEGIVATGLLYVDQEQRDLHDVLETTERPLNALSMAELCPGSKRLEEINRRLR
jgi:2-oxoglutarate ferredoxin oxidoreductase subunit beta